MSDHDVNHMVLTGHVDGELEMRYTSDGEPYTTFFMTSVSMSITGQHRTEQFRLLARGEMLADRCRELAPKARLLVIGQLHYCSSDNAADCRRFPLEVCVEQIILFGTPPDGLGSAVRIPGPRGPAPMGTGERRVETTRQPVSLPSMPCPRTSQRAELLQ